MEEFRLDLEERKASGRHGRVKQARGDENR